MCSLNEDGSIKIDLGRMNYICGNIQIESLKFDKPFSFFVKGHQICDKVTEMTAEVVQAYNAENKIVPDNKYPVRFRGSNMELKAPDLELSALLYDIPDRPTNVLELAYYDRPRSKKAQKKAHAKANQRMQKMAAEKQAEMQAAAEVDRQRWIDEQVKLAKIIFKEVRASLKNTDFLALSDKERVSMYQKKYPNFNKQHPLVIRYMVGLSQFRERAFRRYLDKVSNTQAGDPDHYIQRQADYAALLWKELNPKYNPKQAKQVWEDAYKMMKDEKDNFKELQDEANQTATRLESEYQHIIKYELEQQIEKMRNTDDYQKDIIKTVEELHEEASESESEDEIPQFTLGQSSGYQLFKNE